MHRWDGRLKAEASDAHRNGLGTVRGLVNGFVFTIGIWLAIMGLVLLILR